MEAVKHLGLKTPILDLVVMARVDSGQGLCRAIIGGMGHVEVVCDGELYLLIY